jgi:hypothetical protein
MLVALLHRFEKPKKTSLASLTLLYSEQGEEKNMPEYKDSTRTMESSLRLAAEGQQVCMELNQSPAQLYNCRRGSHPARQIAASLVEQT